MKKFSSVFSCFHTDIMNKYIFPVQQKIFWKISWKFSVTYFSGKAPSLYRSHLCPQYGQNKIVRQCSRVDKENQYEVKIKNSTKIELAKSLKVTPFHGQPAQ